MTQKELLYLEDAVGHEQIIIELLQKSIDTASDKKLIRFFEKELDNHYELCQKIIKHMEDVANE